MNILDTIAEKIGTFLHGTPYTIIDLEQALLELDELDGFRAIFPAITHGNENIMVVALEREDGHIDKSLVFAPGQHIHVYEIEKAGKEVLHD